MGQYQLVVENDESTVVTEYHPQTQRSDAYQSEPELEREFIRLLREQGYEYVTIHSEQDLIENLRIQLEQLNQYHFTDGEWDTFSNTT